MLPCGANRHIAYGYGGVSEIRGRPHFSCRVIRTSVRYTASCVPLCSYCVFPHTVSFCASCSCYISSWWKRSRGSCGVNSLLSKYIVSSRLLRLVGRLAFASCGGVLSISSRCASRVGVSLCFLFSRLVVASCSVRGGVSFVGRFMLVVFRCECFVSLRFAHCVSRRGRLVLFFRLVFRLVSFRFVLIRLVLLLLSSVV